jgi:tetratricopeptide (TPR) repeat protein
MLALYEVRLEPWQTKELSRILPELGETPEPLTSETDQLRFYEAQSCVFQGAFEAGMQTVSLDDLQFFDEASFKALLFILGKHWGKPNSLQTVLVFRRGELNAEHETALRAMLPPSGVMLDVLPLNNTQVKDLVQSLGVTELETLETTLHGYTGGNPLFMIETMKSVLESGSGKLSTSAKVQTLLQQRLDKLSQAATRLAWTAAVAQTDFSLELAGEVLQQSPFELAEPLAELEQRQIFVGERFSHDLIFETALTSIAAPVKKYLHKRMAEVLEKQQVNPALIAKHFLDANDYNKALPFLEQAANNAKRDFQLLDAATLGEKIADILEAQGKIDEAFEHLSKARGCLSSSYLNEQIEHLLERMMVLAQSDDQRAESYHALSSHLEHSRGDYPASEIAAHNGLKVVQNPKIRSLLLGNLGVALMRQNRHTESIIPLREAVSLDKDYNSENLALSLGNLSQPLQSLGQYPEAMQLQEQSIALLRQQSLNDDLIVALCNYAITLTERGYIKRAIEPLQEALGLQQKVQGIDIPISRTFISLGSSFRDLCFFKDALECFRKAFEIVTQNNDLAKGYFAASLARVYSLLGQSKLAKDFLDEAIKDPLHPHVRNSILFEKGHWLIEQGQGEKVLVIFGELKQSISSRKLSSNTIYLLEAKIRSKEENLQIAQNVLRDIRENDLEGALGPNALIRYAQASLKLEQNKQALEATQEAVKLLEIYDSYFFYLGEVYLTHYQALRACKDKTAKAYLEQTVKWLMDVAHNHVPSDYRESFLNNNLTNKSILQAATAEGLLEKGLADLV